MIEISVKSSRATALVGEDWLLTLAITTRVIGSTKLIPNKHSAGGGATSVQCNLKTPCDPSISGTHAPIASDVCIGAPKVPSELTSQKESPFETGCIQ